MGLLAGFMPYCSTKFPRRNGPSIASALPPVCLRSKPFETVKDLKGLAVSPERAILEADYGIETYESYLWSQFTSAIEKQGDSSNSLIA